MIVLAKGSSNAREFYGGSRSHLSGMSALIAYRGIPKAMRLFLEMQQAAMRRCVCAPCKFAIPVVADGSTRECGQIHHASVRRAHWRTEHGAM